MKKILLLLAGIVFIISCNNNDDARINNDNAVVGSWVLVETLSDPGDGSGTFQPVESNKVLTFNANGTVASNGYICNMIVETGESTNGTYSVDNNTISTDCNDEVTYTIPYSFSNGYLILNHQCIEPCQEKYARVLVD